MNKLEEKVLKTYKELDYSIPKHLYHYTSMNGLIGIINSKKLRASDILFLNDEKEF